MKLRVYELVVFRGGGNFYCLFFWGFSYSIGFRGGFVKDIVGLFFSFFF